MCLWRRGAWEGLAFAGGVPLLLLSWMAGVRLRGGGLGVFVRCAGAFLAFTFEVCRGFVLPLLGLVKVRGCDGRRGLVGWGGGEPQSLP